MRRAKFLLILPLFCFGIQAQEMSKAESEVWAGEEAYCAHLTANDLDGFMKLWRDDFVGWPSNAPSPVDKAGIRGLYAARGRVTDCKVTRKSVSVFGKVGITQLELRQSFVRDDGHTGTRAVKATHTWVKTGDTWQIAGGMSATLEAKQQP
jgi:ketosteroid isomerase-like protein